MGWGYGLSQQHVGERGEVGEVRRPADEPAYEAEDGHPHAEDLPGEAVGLICLAREQLRAAVADEGVCPSLLKSGKELGAS